MHQSNPSQSMILTLVAGGKGGKRGRHGWMASPTQGTRSLSKLRDVVKDKEARRAAVHAVAVTYDRVTKQPVGGLALSAAFYSAETEIQRLKLSKLLEQFPVLHISPFILFPLFRFPSISLLLHFMYSIRVATWYAIGKLFLSLASTALLRD